MKTIKTVGVIGAGTMGAALAQKFAQEDFNVILADREMKFVEQGLNNIRSMLNKGIGKNVFTDEQVKKYLSNIKGTSHLSDLKECDLIVEAIFEDFKAKTDLFKSLNGIITAQTILATNTSSFSVNELSEFAPYPDRFIGLHYFYHAAKNRLVEIIPGNKTSVETFDAAKIFCVQSGKDAITCKDSYGFVVNRFFVPWLNESVKLLQAGIGTIETIDSVCMKTFGIGMGPFALMNATGVPIALHAQRTLESFGHSYRVATLLEQQVAKKENWQISDAPVLNINSESEKIINERMLGCVFFICTQIFNDRVCSAIDLNKGAKIGLRWRKGPVDLMRQFGETEVKRLIENYANHYGEKIPDVSSAAWKMEYVTLEKRNDNAVFTMNRPEDLNALNEDVVKQLDENFSEAEMDSSVQTIYITGSGKAFVAGADIKYFIKNIKSNKIGDIESFTQFGQKVFAKIDESKKKVVAVINGLALGGGLELALCADVILALPKAQMAFPETGIGIYPGLGGTQRCAKRIGKALSKYLIHTGKMLNATDAFEIGLVDNIVSVQEMFELFSGEKVIPPKEKFSLNEKWKNIQNFFEKNSLQNILQKNFYSNGMKPEDAEKISKTLSRKAPVALRIADNLIEEAKGCDSELKHLREIFSTSDALLGLSSVGKQVEYQGK